eukprot:3718909-Amphidinium_carterae.1
MNCCALATAISYALSRTPADNMGTLGLPSRDVDTVGSNCLTRQNYKHMTELQDQSESDNTTVQNDESKDRGT